MSSPLEYKVFWNNPMENGVRIKGSKLWASFRSYNEAVKYCDSAREWEKMVVKRGGRIQYKTY